MSAIISGLIGGAIAAAICTYLAKRVGHAAVPGQLRFGPFMWILAALCLVLSVLPVISTWQGHDEDFWVKAALAIGFGIGAIGCFAEAAFVKGTFDGKGISYSTPWTGAKRERWEDLESVALNEMAGWYTLTFKSGTRIRLSRYLGGHMSALESAEAARRA